MSPTPEVSERQRKAAFKAWETIRKNQAKKQAEAGAVIAKASKAASEILKTEEAQKTRISLERDLQAALRENIEQIEPGLIIIDGGKEKISPSGRTDILAMDANRRTVVIELKVGTASHDVFGQIQSYMGDLMTEIGGPVRGIIIARDFDSKAIAASKPVPNIELLKYSFNFTFKKI